MIECLAPTSKPCVKVGKRDVNLVASRVNRDPALAELNRESEELSGAVFAASPMLRTRKVADVTKILEHGPCLFE